jgi:hypothetical protein
MHGWRARSVSDWSWASQVALAPGVSTQRECATLLRSLTPDSPQNRHTARPHDTVLSLLLSLASPWPFDQFPPFL